MFGYNYISLKNIIILNSKYIYKNGFSFFERELERNEKNFPIRLFFFADNNYMKFEKKKERENFFEINYVKFVKEEKKKNLRKKPFLINDQRRNIYLQVKRFFGFFFLSKTKQV